MKLFVILLCLFAGACKKEHDKIIAPEQQHPQQKEIPSNEAQIEAPKDALATTPVEKEVPPKDIDPVEPLAGFTKYNITKGSHSSDKSGLQSTSVDSMVFEVLFDSTAIYTTQLRENQGDINKLYGFSDCSSFHHSNSARFGWRFHKNGLELFAYTYAQGKRSFASLGSIEVNKKYTCTIVAKKGSYVFYLNDSEPTLMERGCSNGGFQFKLFPYFGGNEPAPHNISIWIKDIR